MSKLFELKAQLTATRPRSWTTHLRYARLVGGQEITLEALQAAQPSSVKEAGDAS